MRFTTEELRCAGILDGLPDSDIAWFAEHGEKIELLPGEHMFDRGEPADFMFIVITGAIEGYEEVGGQELLVATTSAGHVTGMLPFSRMTHYPRYTVATSESSVLRIHKDDFPEMLAASQETGMRLVAVMSDRVRGDVRLEQQHEKMTALGRLSAGLAHELNNPTTAVRRAAAGLASEMAELARIVSALAQHGAEASHIEAIGRLQDVAHASSAKTISPLLRSEREEKLIAWLEDREIARAWELGPTFADAGLNVGDMETFARSVPETLVADALAWVACGLSVQRIVEEIASSGSRISELVGSVKMYSQMGQSQEHKPIDVREGIDSTLLLLSSRLKQKNIRVVREFPDPLPTVQANAGELNQVWTNLVENAMEAVTDGGEIRIELREVDSHLEVRILDNGRGIPAEHLARIFEPFFTTKGVGEGTGLGLDIAMRIVSTHRGHITVRSESGWTEARVRIPTVGVKVGAVQHVAE